LIEENRTPVWPNRNSNFPKRAFMGSADWNAAAPGKRAVNLVVPTQAKGEFGPSFIRKP
jgi:hypothetical protein